MPDDTPAPSKLPTLRPGSGTVSRSAVAARLDERRETSPRSEARTVTMPPPRHLGPALEGEDLPALLAGAIRAALASAGGGLEVGAPPNVGRLFFTHGAIAWIAAPRGGEKLSTLLRLRASVSAEALRAVIARCKASGRSIVDGIVESQLLDRAVLRAVVLEHNARQLDAILALPSLEQVQFRPASRAYLGALTFSLDETLAELARVRREPLEAEPVTRELPVAAVAATRIEKENMANISASLKEVMSLDGAIAAAIVDWESGMTLGTAGGEGGRLDIELAASGNTSVVKAKMAVMRQLGIPGAIEDILITLGPQYHLIRPLAKNSSLFFSFAIDRAKGNLGLARHKLRVVEEALVV